MDKMILGRYIPGNSLIHRLDPRSKLLSMFLFVLIIFWANNLATNLLLFVFTFFLVFLSRVPIGFFVKGLQSMLFLVAFTTIFQLLFTTTGNTLVQFSFTVRIMNAQRARGVDFGEGNIVQKVKSIIPILIPLFASSFKRADALAIAMEARGYQGGDQRSRYRQLKWQNKDSYAILVLLILGAILYLLKN